jgi:hypothetical protein
MHSTRVFCLASLTLSQEDKADHLRIFTQVGWNQGN